MTLAGNDPSGGAGIPADIETLISLGCHPAPVLTALTVQDTHNVQMLLPVAPDQVLAQARAVLEDMPVTAFKIGVIGSVTEPFCSSCDRIRLTADGQLRACLFSTDEVDLRAILRSGGTDDDLASAVARTVAGKWAGHGITSVGFTRPARSMSQIGG
mgnify:CR=1 FL=1